MIKLMLRNQFVDILNQIVMMENTSTSLNNK